MKHTVLTIIVEIDPDKQAVLIQMLDEIRLHLLDNAYLPFSEIELLHFASLIITDSETTGVPLLIFENNFDGGYSTFFDKLLLTAGEGLHKIYQCSKSYKWTTYRTEDMKHFLTENIVRPNTYHIGNVGRPIAVIKENQQLRQNLQNYLDDLFSTAKPVTFSQSELRAKMEKFIADNHANWLRKLAPRQTFLEKLIPKVNLYGVLAVILILIIAFWPLAFILLIIFLVVVTLILRGKENKDPADFQPPSVSAIEALIKTENRFAQNHLANITQIKPGLFRLTLLKIVLFAANLLARTSTNGTLSGIPSIHFAHWSIINNDKQLLFLSNFDGSWSSYLDDFIDKASRGLTGIWSNTQGFPKTKFLVLDGAKDELRFKAFARCHQVPSLIWYSAYRDLTVQNIDKDSLIREQLGSSDNSDTATSKWLKLF
jgi:hypothetical protein